MARQLSIINPNPQKLPGPENLHRLIATDSNDGRPAIEFLSPSGQVESLSYQQLHHKANSLARVLKSQFLYGTNNRATRLIVPLFMQQSPQLYISELAILKTGAAFCPLSLDVPEERLRFILDDVQATVLLTTSDLQEKLPPLEPVSVVTVDDVDLDAEDESLPDHVKPSSPAYIMYTSGSTGQPKGVILSHSAATQALLAHDRHIPEFSRFLQFASPTFDVSVFEIFFPLFRGQTLICGERRRLLNDLPDFIDSMRVDAAELTPSVASSLLNGRRQLPSLKLLLTIGEMLKRDVVEEYGGASSDQSTLWGMYGPTEATIHCTLQPAFTSDMPTGNIGIPLDTVSAFVVKPQSDKEQTSDKVEILPIGEEGELAVGGHQLADGYLNRPEQTKAAFVTHEDFGPLYRTGDRVKLTSDGTLVCSGRISSGQVKLRGQRIELGEIEYAAGKTPGCQSVVAEIVSGSLIVFCAIKSSKCDETDVRDTCRKWLPAFMVPADVVVLDELPYLDSGKANRKALREIYESRKAQISAKADEDDAQVQAIVNVISTVLQVDINGDTSLLAAGLDSLSSIRISSQLKRAGFPRLDASTILDARTVRDLDASLRNQDSKESSTFSPEPQAKTSEIVDVARSHPALINRLFEIDHIYEATITQSSMLMETARNNKAYCNRIELELPDTFRADEVSASVQKLADAHSLLRSGFIAIDGFQAGHAVVVWKQIHPSQIRYVDGFDFDFRIYDELGLLQPCSFQIRKVEDSIRILLQIHHAQYDQWSIDVLRRDLDAISRAQQCPPRPSFETVSQFRHSEVVSAKAEDSLEFWNDLLRDFAPTHVPPITGRKLEPSLRRSSWYTLDCNLSKMRTKARELQCSVPAIFQSATAYLLGSYVGSTDVTFGVVLSGRHIPVEGIEQIFGPCLDTLPLRLDFSTVRTCAELARLVHFRNRALQKHSMVPLSDIKGLFKELGNTQLFDTLFVWQETSLASEETELLVQEIDSADRHEYNLVFEFEPTQHGLRLRVTFQQALLASEQIACMVAQIQHYAKHIMKEMDSLVEEMIDSLPDSALSVSNSRPQQCARDRDLVRSVEMHAITRPLAPAIIFSNDLESSMMSLTYRQLNEHSNQLARYLISQGPVSSRLVCIYMHKSIDLYVAILAAIKAGFGYLPIIPETPIARVQSILQQAQIAFCICDDKTNENLKDAQSISVMNLATLDISDNETANLDFKFPEERIAYTVFTSGSTGEPKGVPLTMKNLTGNLQALSELYPFTSGDRLLQACSHAFDVSVFEIFFTFYNGLCLCAAPKEVLFSDFEGYIRHFDITHLSLTPTVAALVDPMAVPSVTFLITAGEAVTNMVHARWADKGLHQGYGPSETTNICSVKMSVSSGDAINNVGPPLRNTSAFVLSDGPRPKILPTGALGELAFGGEQVFPGYVGRKDLNETKILHHPHHGRIYRSGDLGRILPDGSMLVSGRLDDQVKVRGNRVELGEINALLLRNEGVRDCATMVVGHDASNHAIASFVVLENQSGSFLDIADENFMSSLFDSLEDSLPSYMIPSTITLLSDMPRTSQGKLDHRLLRQLLVDQQSSSARTYRHQSQVSDDGAEWSSTEIKVTELLARTMSTDNKTFTRRLSLFSYGLNSLNAISFAKSLSREFDVRVSVGAILRNPTIARLARMVEDGRKPDMANGHVEDADLLPSHVTGYVRGLSIFQEEDIECLLPCTPLQVAMLSASSATAENAYWNSLTLCINGDVQNLKRCWEDMIKRHEILRTRFVNTKDRTHPFVQVVLPSAILPWSHLHSSSAQSSVDSQTFTSNKKQELATMSPFHLEHFDRTDGITLVLHMHHAIYDGLSISRLLQEVEASYNGIDLLQPPSFEPFLREAEKHSGKDAMEFWTNEVRNFSPKPFPRIAVETRHKEQVIQSTLSIASGHLDTFCKHHSFTQLAVLQAALTKTLAVLQSTIDVCFGNVVSGRSVPVEGVENLIAPCFNTIPLRVSLRENMSNFDLAAKLNQKNIDLLPYQLTPLRRIQALSLSPSKRLFDCLLILQPPQKPLDSKIWSLVHESGDMDMPLVFELAPEDETLNFVMHYSERHLTKSGALSLAELFGVAIKSCLEYPFGAVEDFCNYDLSKIAGLLKSSDRPQRVANNTTDSIPAQCSEQESAICAVFAQLAGLSQDSIQQNTSMFQIGLDSLNAPQVAAQLRSARLRVDAGDVLECLTPALIAQRAASRSLVEPQTHIDLRKFDKKHRRGIIKQLRIANSGIESIWPCTSAQIGMLSQSLQSNGNLYINHITYRVPTTTSTENIKTAWMKLIAKYQVLRMGLHKTDDLDTPFAMSIFNVNLASFPLSEHNGKISVGEAESQGRRKIMRSMNKCAWCVQILEQNNSLLMCLSLHHAIYDAASLHTILQDFDKAINSAEIDESVNIGEALSANLNAAMDTSGDSSRFWSNELDNSSISRFPNLTPTVVGDKRVEQENLTLSLPSETIETFCKAQNATIQALGQTAWAILLASYIGDDKVMFGTIFSGHPGNHSNAAAFPSINTIPVPCDTSCGALNLFQDMVRFNASANRHRFKPLVQIQRLSGHDHGPLFDTVFVHQIATSSDTAIAWPVVAETAAVDYAASLELQTNRKRPIALRLTFTTDRIPLEQARIILQQYEHTLRQIVLDETSLPTPIYSILPAKQPEIASPARLLHEMVERTAAAYPERPALTFVYDSANNANSAVSWTYAQLNSRANQVANLIADFRIAPGSVVAVCMEKSPEASFAFFGILKAGCSFLAIDPDLPKSRLDFILQDSGAKLLLVNADRANDFAQDDAQCIELSEKAMNACSSSLIEPVHTSPEATCYCLYTSGTTGTPKGCEITHENAVQAMMSFQRLFSGHWTDRSRWLQFASYWFDVSVLEQFWSWAVGIEVVGAPRDVVLEDLPGFISQQRITHIDLTPSLARLVQPEDVPSLWGGVFITGGEALKQEIIDSWGPKNTICNGYGPTEATIGVTMNTFIGRDAKPSNIGQQFDNVGAFVLRRDSDQPVLRGAVGELCVSGKLVGKGYLNRPELTANQFPTLARFKERVYRTGDLVRVLADGSFSFIGRQDSQVKLRGQRLETAEIDNVLQNSAEDVAHAVSLISKAGPDKKETLVSYITKNARNQVHDLSLDRSDEGLNLVKIAKKACTDRLPTYMVPTHILPIDFLPLTANNKIDAKRLQELFGKSSIKDLQHFAGSTGDASSMTATGQQIRSLLADLLCIDAKDITPDSNLFSVGLSSISAISFSSVLKREGFKKANVAAVMQNPTIRQLSNAIAGDMPREQKNGDPVSQAKLSISAFAQRHSGLATRALGVSRDDIESVVPCTPLQQGLILDSMRMDGNPYFNDFCYIAHEVDVTKLRNSIQELIRRTQILRTRFFDTDHGTAQVVLKHVSVPTTEWRQSQYLTLEAHMRDLKRVWIEENSQNLVQPFEVHFIRTADEQFICQLHIHHALYDGISLDLLLRQLYGLYHRENPENTGPDFITALPYGPLRQMKFAREFWQQRLEGCPSRLLSASNSFNGDDIVSVGKTFDMATMEPARKALGVSHQALMQGCFEIALRKCVKQVHLYGVVVSGRSIELPDAEQIVGPMFNTLPQPLCSITEPTLGEYIRSRHEGNVATLPYQHTSLREIRKWAKWHSGDALFDILFVFQHVDQSRKDAITTFLQPVEQKSQAHYALACEVEMSDDGCVSMQLVAQQKYLHETVIQSLADEMGDVWQCLLHDADANLVETFEMETEPASPLEQNGVHRSEEVNGVHGFEWTKSALSVRSEIAALLKLNEAEVDEHSTIFSLGLDSIDAVKLASRLRKLGLSIPTSKVLRAQTIPKILNAVEEGNVPLQHTESTSMLAKLKDQLLSVASTLTDLDVDEIESILPATPTQEALLADMFRTDFKEYFNHDVLRLRSDTDLNRLKNAWQTVIDHSPILRTVFVEVAQPNIETVFAQVVTTQRPQAFDVRECADVEGFADIFDQVRRGVSNGMGRHPPFRLTVVKTEGDTYLILSLAHAQYDGHSLALLHQDVFSAYSDSFSPRPPYDPEVEALIAAVNDEALRFWADTLSGITPCAFPQLGFEGAVSRTSRRERTATISSTVSRTFCKSYGVSMQALVQTCWALTLAHYTRRMEVIFGVVLACRDSKEAEDAMFPTMNTVALRAVLHGSRAQMIQNIQSFGTEMLPYQRTPLRTVRGTVLSKIPTTEVSPENGLFDTLFIYQHRPTNDESNALYDSVGGSSDVEYPVAVEIEAPDDGPIIIRGACRNSVLDETGTEQLLETVEEVLNAIINAPDEPTVDFDGEEVSICGMEPFVPDNFESSATESESSTQSASVDAALTSTISSIVEALAQMSKLPASDISPSTTIESIGIDSISAIKVAAMLRKQDVHLSVSEILKAKTPARMAEALQSKQVSKSAEEQPSRDVVSSVVQKYMTSNVLRAVGIDPESIETVLPATAGQIYMLNMWQKTSGQLFYSTFKYQINATARTEKIQNAWTALGKHHPILRTAFCAIGDLSNPILQVVQRKDRNGDMPQPMVSIQVDKNEPGLQISLTIHHALYDAVSLPLLMRDLALLVADKPVPPPKLCFEDYLATSVTHRARQLRKRFWSEYLNDINALSLTQPTTDGPQQKVEIFRPNLFSSIDEIEQAARKQDLTLQSILFAAYAKIYADIASSSNDQSEHVVLGIYLSNRSHLSDLETLAAPTVNLVPLLIRSPQQHSLLDIAKKVQEDLQAIGSVENSAVGLWEVEQWTGVKVDTFVNFLKLPGGDEDAEGVSMRPLNEERLQERSRVVEPEGASEFEVPKELEGMRGLGAYQHSLDIEMTVTDGKLDVGLFCPESMLGLEQAEEALREFKALLEKFVGKAKE